MPLPNWLSSILHGSLSSAPTPDGAVSPNQPAEHDDKHAARKASPDNDVRAHIAAHDPAFPAHREKAIDAISAAVDSVALARGFTRKPQSWAKSGRLGTVSLHIQRGRYGLDCAINLSFHPLDENRQGPWAQEDAISLGRFHPSRRNSTDDGTSLFYLDVIEDPNMLPVWMAVLSDHALPWLLAHLTQDDAAEQPLCPS
jgi:hypothetical protein